MFWYFVSQSSVFLLFMLFFLFDGPIRGLKGAENEPFSWFCSLFANVGLERGQKATTFVDEKQRLCLRL